MRPLLRPRWIAAHALVLAIAVAFVSLGMWQLRRLDDKRTFNRTLEARGSMPIMDVNDLLASTTPSEAAYRRVTARGAFRTDEEVILRARSRKGIAGHHVLTPLRTAGGAGVIVNRGWVELTMDEPPVREAAPPTGEVIVTGVLFPSQARGRFGPQDPLTGELEQIWRIDVPRLQQQVNYRLHPLWLHVERQEPAQPGEFPKSIQLPSLDEGPHLSYALQWFAFTLTVLVGYAAVIRSRLKKLSTPEPDPARADLVG